MGSRAPHRPQYQRVRLVRMQWMDMTTRSPGKTERSQSKGCIRSLRLLENCLKTAKSPRATRPSPGKLSNSRRSQGWSMLQLRKYSYGSIFVRFKASVRVMLLPDSSRGLFMMAKQVRSCAWMMGRRKAYKIATSAPRLPIERRRTRVLLLITMPDDVDCESGSCGESEGSLVTVEE